MALGLAVLDDLRAGNLYLADSRQHGQFGNLVYDDARWSAEREQGYARLALPAPTRPVFEHPETDWTTAAAKALEGLAGNPLAALSKGRLQLRRQDAWEIPESTKPLRRVLNLLFKKCGSSTSCGS
jgi:hypothetical protein